MHSESMRQIVAADGYHLAATCYLPAGEPLGVVMIASAMAVEQRYYAPIANWLAGKGWQVISFDYRGMGKSRHGPLALLDVDLQGWARLDCDAVLREAVIAAEGKPVIWLGHSLGGQLPAFMPDMERVHRVITIAAGSGYWFENAWPLKRRVWLLWFLVAPMATRLLGYFPGARLGMVGDLPAGVIRQWRRWCLNPEYAIGAEGPDMARQFAEMSAPISGFAFSDDELMSKRNIEWLHNAYSETNVDFQYIHPANLGLKQVGHFGFFRPEHEAMLWPMLLAPVLAQHA